MTVSDQIIQVLNALCEKFGIVIDWTSENVIPYLGELCGKLVNYEIWTSVAWMAMVVVLSIIGIVIKVVCREQFDNMWDEGHMPLILLSFVIVAVWFGTIAVLGTQIMDIIKCVTFPEMYIFEYIQGLISSGG